LIYQKIKIFHIELEDTLAAGVALVIGIFQGIYFLGTGDKHNES